MNARRIAELLVAALAVIVLVIIVSEAIGQAAFYPPNWNTAHRGFPRQVKQLTYINWAGGGANQRHVVLGLIKVQTTNATAPTCMYGGRDLFNPSGAGDSKPVSGLQVTFYAHGARQTLTVPNSQVPTVPYAGNELRVKFLYVPIALYYDNFYSSLWNTQYGADGPKTHVINCMRTLSLGQKMELGLVNAVFFVPRHGGPMALQLPS